jgi:hypothetical protein
VLDFSQVSWLAYLYTDLGRTPSMHKLSFVFGLAGVLGAASCGSVPLTPDGGATETDGGAAGSSGGGGSGGNVGMTGGGGSTTGSGDSTTGAAGSTARDPLVGTWTAKGVGQVVNITFTVASDKTFTIVDVVAPVVAGPGKCVTRESFFASYAETISGSTSTMTWTFTGGTRNAVSGCPSASDDSAGFPMTADALNADIGIGIFPPTTVTYVVTPTTLELRWSPIKGGPNITFTKSH